MSARVLFQHAKRETRVVAVLGDTPVRLEDGSYAPAESVSMGQSCDVFRNVGWMPAVRVAPTEATLTIRVSGVDADVEELESAIKRVLGGSGFGYDVLTVERGTK